MSDELTRETTIGKNVITTHLFLGSRSNKMMVRLQQCMQGHQIICSPDTWQQFCIEFLAFTSIDGKQLDKITNFDSVFAGNLGLLMAVINFVSEANFGKDFLSQGGNTGDTTQPEPPSTSV